MTTLAREFHALHVGMGLGSRLSGGAQTFDVIGDRFLDQLDRIVPCFAGRDSARQVGRISPVGRLALFDHNSDALQLTTIF